MRGICFDLVDVLGVVFGCEVFTMCLRNRRELGGEGFGSVTP